MLFNAFILALSASIDSLGVGISYGIKKTKIYLSSFFVLFVLSIIVTSISILAGHLITSFVSNDFVTILGSLILFGIGVFIIYGATVKKKNKLENSHYNLRNNKNTSSKICKKKSKEYNFFIKCLGITINIIKDPVSSDIDNSNKIDIKEAMFLGIALSLDSISIGFGASIIGVNKFVFPLLISLFQVLFMILGMNIGKNINNISKLPNNIWSIISGIILILIGLIKIIFI